MDRLPVERQEQLKKCSTERLRSKLVEAGHDKDAVAKLDRTALMEAMAQLLLRPSFTDSDFDPQTQGNVDKEIRLRELALEEKRLAAAEKSEQVKLQYELKLLEDKKAEREAETKKAEREAETRKAEAIAETEKQKVMAEAEKQKALAEVEKQKSMTEAERQKTELENYKIEQLKLELEIKKIEASVRTGQPDTDEGHDDEDENGEEGAEAPRSSRWDQTLAGRTKKYGDTLRHVLPNMPTEYSQLPQFFDTIEKLYAIYQVPVDLQAKLLIPRLTEHAKSIIVRMTAENLEKYCELKKFLLAEYKLTPREYKNRFENASKNADETYVLFTARLRNLLMYYLRSRDVSDFEGVCDLFVSDKLKSCLTAAQLNYVLSLEGEGWYKPDKVATLADIHYNNRPSAPSVRTTDHKAAKTVSTAVVTDTQTHGNVTGRGCYNGRGGSHSPSKRCYVCNALDHLAKSCPRGRGRGRGNFRGHRGGGQSGKAQVNLCSTLGIQTCQDVGTQYEKPTSVAETWEFGNFPESASTAAVTSVDLSTQVKIYSLQYVNVNVSGHECCALNDSGCQIPIVSARVFDYCKDNAIGSVILSGFGQNQRSEAPLVNLEVSLSCENDECNIAPKLPIVCAITDLDSLEYDVILPSDVIAELRSLPVIAVTKVVDGCDRQSVLSNVGNDCTTLQSDQDQVSDVNVDDVGNSVTHSTASHNAILQEQLNDDSLVSCWKLAKVGKGGFLVHDELLYHRDKVEGQTVSQLCLPHSRRSHVLKLAHDSVFGGHMGERKTRERIRLSFYWPGLRQSVHDYVSSCTNCQLRSRTLATDRVPITPITRADIPFQVMNMDCIGPIDPPSSQGHRYCLCIVDSCTRWPSVYMLKSLTAKAVCDALLDLFVNVGVPKVIVSDRGTNFTSQLTTELLSRLGCSPRFNTPGHPEASGMVERFNQSCKNMLSHLILQHKRQWHKYLPLAVWALREVPNATTGVSPYMLVYGRTPRGPLAVLKESWTGERDLPGNLGKPVEAYLEELKSKMETATKFAEQHTQKAQTSYAAHYNLRARDKKFQEGDQVIVLAPEGGNKLNNRWQGPATVAKVKSPYSYLIDMGDGCVRNVHANKIRRFVARVQGCGVIGDKDVDFGRVLTPMPVVPSVLPSQRIEASKLAHLEPAQRDQLVQLLDEFADCFSDKPGLCDVVTHRIQTTPNFVPRQMHPYRVPAVFKDEVDRQISELLAMGLIQRSSSPMASPIVCVAKKDGGVRIACDYRYLNSYTIGDAYPMTTVADTLNNLGAAKLISTFDAKSGYWQIPIAEEDRWLTAFVTHDGLYEWVRMPFGLKNAGATFVRAVRAILQPIRQFAESYVDDMGVGSNGWSEHLGHIREFLSIMRRVGMTLNLAKCDFARSEVKFVGHFVGSGIRRPDPQRLEGFAQLERPQTKRDLRKLLGAFGYYREYIPHFADIAKPLTDLTCKNAPNILIWQSEHQRAFEILRAKMCDAHVLRIPQMGRPFTLHTDASGYAVGATLGQVDENDVEQPLAFASQKLTGPQTAWATIEREAYAIIWALNRFRDTIYGSKITVFCDHNPLQYIRECAPKSAKLLRWSLALQEFDLDFRYTKGSSNVVADWLSRAV